MINNIYKCRLCTYETFNKKDYNKHMNTKKHCQNTSKLRCDICNKEYKYKSGLSRHRKLFHSDVHSTQNKKIDNLEKMLKNALDENKKTIDTIIPKIGNTYTTNKMTINVFLNEACKNAINIGDFISNLNISLDDLEYTTDHGYVKGISNIFNKHLNDLKPTERPIHCSDKKRLQFYIKDEDIWKRDESNTRIDKTINQISHIQIKQIKEWEHRHPHWTESNKETQMYLKMIREIMGGCNDEEILRNKTNIKKELVNSIDIKAALREI